MNKRRSPAQQTILDNLRSGIDWTHDGPTPGETTCDCNGLTDDSCEYGRKAAASMRTVAKHLEAGEMEEASMEESQWGDDPATQAWKDSLGPRERVATLRVAETVVDGHARLEAGTYTVAMPMDYDPAEVTAADILHDGLVYVLGQGEPETYTIIWGHSGTQGRNWTSARDASRYAGEQWGTVVAPDGETAIKIAELEGLEVGDWYEEMDSRTIHVVAPRDAEEARASIRDAYKNDPEGTITAIRDRFNCQLAEIDDDGDVWIAEPQAGHWLKDADLLDLVDWMEDL